MERWKDIEGYEGKYKISSLGRVKSLNYNHTKSERILKQDKDRYGYLYVVLCTDGKRITKKVHRLVAQAFIDNPDNLPQVNHKNEDKTMNYVENLEWCTNKYNCNYGTRNERMSKKVLCVETNIIYPSTREAGRQINSSSIVSCLKGRRKTAGGYHWRYAD